MRFPSARILVFAKAPIAGACKTRLAPALGDEGAARLAEALLYDTVARLSLARLAPIDLWCTPDAAHPLFIALAERFELQLKTQQGADLGARMQSAAAATLAHAQRLVLIGADCPDLDAEYLQQALSALSQYPAVLGPADDGGYVLLGLRREMTASLATLFAPMPWGSDQVAARTRKRMHAAGLDWLELPRLADIDRPEDLLRVDLARFRLDG